MFDGDKLIAKEPLSWEKSFNMAVVIPHKIRNCDKGAEDVYCDGSDKLVNQFKTFSANLNGIKEEAPNEFGHMLPKYIIT